MRGSPFGVVALLILALVLLAFMFAPEGRGLLPSGGMPSLSRQ